MEITKLLEPDRSAGKLFYPAMLHLVSDGPFVPLQKDAVGSAEEALDDIWVPLRRWGTGILLDMIDKESNCQLL